MAVQAILFQWCQMRMKLSIDLITEAEMRITKSLYSDPPSLEPKNRGIERATKPSITIAPSCARTKTANSLFFGIYEKLKKDIVEKHTYGFGSVMESIYL
jgi:hypothetical protein